MSKTQTVLFRAITGHVLYTTGKYIFVGMQETEGGTIRQMWTNQKQIPAVLKEAWDRLSRERGEKVWNVQTKKWVD